MPGDSVNEIYPLSQLRPIAPHPADVRQERKRRKKRDRGKEKNKRDGTGRDRVSLEKNRHAQKAQPKKPLKVHPEDSMTGNRIDIKI